MQPDLAAMQAAGADQLAQSYLALAGAALSRVEDAARGATERTAHGA